MNFTVPAALAGVTVAVNFTKSPANDQPAGVIDTLTVVCVADADGSVFCQWLASVNHMWPVKVPTTALYWMHCTVIV